MHCMGHWYAIRGVKACSSFRWIKQFTHLSVAKLLIESKNRGRVIPVLSIHVYLYMYHVLYQRMILWRLLQLWQSQGSPDPSHRAAHEPPALWNFATQARAIGYAIDNVEPPAADLG